MAEDQSASRYSEWVQANAPDCGDNSCMFGGRGKGGMRTNGGCRCFRDLPTKQRIFVERMFSALSELTRSVAVKDMEIIGHREPGDAHKGRAWWSGGTWLQPGEVVAVLTLPKQDERKGEGMSNAAAMKREASK